MTPTARWIPRLTYGVAAAHAAVGVVIHREPLRAMLADGVVGSAGDDGPRDAAVWFLLAAPATAGIAGLGRWGVERTGELPRPVGVALLGLGAAVVVVDPASGGWLLLGLGVASLLGASGVGQASARRTRAAPR